MVKVVLGLAVENVDEDESDVWSTDLTDDFLDERCLSFVIYLLIIIRCKDMKVFS